MIEDIAGKGRVYCNIDLGAYCDQRIFEKALGVISVDICFARDKELRNL
jgi:hypothetical protein